MWETFSRPSSQLTPNLEPDIFCNFHKHDFCQGFAIQFHQVFFNTFITSNAMVAHLRQKTWQDNNCSIISKKSQVWRLSNIVKDMHWSVCTWWVYNEMQITWIGDLKYYKTNTNTEEKHKYKHKYKYKYKFEEEVWKSDYDSGAKLWCNRIQYKSASFCLAPRLSSLITTTSPFATKHQQYRNSKCNKRTIYKKKCALMHVFYIASHVTNIFFYKRLMIRLCWIEGVIQTDWTKNTNCPSTANHSIQQSSTKGKSGPTNILLWEISWASLSMTL